MRKKIEVEIDATCENCSHYLDDHTCENNCYCQPPFNFCHLWHLDRPAFNDSPRSFMVLEKEED